MFVVFSLKSSCFWSFYVWKLKFCSKKDNSITFFPWKLRCCFFQICKQLHSYRYQRLFILRTSYVFDLDAVDFFSKYYLVHKILWTVFYFIYRMKIMKNRWMNIIIFSFCLFSESWDVAFSNLKSWRLLGSSPKLYFSLEISIRFLHFLKHFTISNWNRASGGLVDFRFEKSNISAFTGKKLSHYLFFEKNLSLQT